MCSNKRRCNCTVRWAHGDIWTINMYPCIIIFISNKRKWQDNDIMQHNHFLHISLDYLKLQQMIYWVHPVFVFNLRMYLTSYSLGCIQCKNRTQRYLHENFWYSWWHNRERNGQSEQHTNDSLLSCQMKWCWVYFKKKLLELLRV